MPRTLGGNILCSSQCWGDREPLTTVLVENYPDGTSTRILRLLWWESILRMHTRKNRVLFFLFFFLRGPRNNVVKPCRYGRVTGVRLPRSDSLPLQLTDLQLRLAPSSVMLQHKLIPLVFFLPEVALIVTVQLSHKKKKKKKASRRYPLPC